MYPLGLVAGYAPRLVSAVAAVDAPVPPLAIATIPDTLAAVPELIAVANCAAV